MVRSTNDEPMTAQVSVLSNSLRFVTLEGNKPTILVDLQMLDSSDDRPRAYAEIARFSNLEVSTVENSLQQIASHGEGVHSVLIKNGSGDVEFVPMRVRKVSDRVGGSNKGLVVKDQNKTLISKSKMTPLTASVPTFFERLEHKFNDLHVDGAPLDSNTQRRVGHFKRIVTNLLALPANEQTFSNVLWRDQPSNRSDVFINLAMFRYTYKDRPEVLSAINQVMNELKQEIKDQTYNCGLETNCDIKRLVYFLEMLTQSENEIWADRAIALTEDFVANDFNTFLSGDAKLLDQNDIYDKSRLSFSETKTLIQTAKQIARVDNSGDLLRRIRSASRESQSATPNNSNKDYSRFQHIPTQNLQKLGDLLELDQSGLQFCLDSAVSKHLKSYSEIGRYISVLLDEQSLTIADPNLEALMPENIDNVVRFEHLQSLYDNSHLSPQKKSELKEILSLIVSHEQSGDQSRQLNLKGLRDFLEIMDREPKMVRALIKKQHNEIRQSIPAAPLRVDNPLDTKTPLSTPVHYANMLGRQFKSGYGTDTRKMVSASLSDLVKASGGHLDSRVKTEVAFIDQVYSRGLKTFYLQKASGTNEDAIRNKMVNRLSGELDRAVTTEGRFTPSLFNISNDGHATNLTITKEGNRTFLTLFDADRGNGVTVDPVSNKQKVIVDLKIDITDNLNENGADLIAVQLVSVMDEDSMTAIRSTLEALGTKLPSEFTRRAQRGGDCSIEAHMACIKSMTSDRTYRIIKSHLLKGAIATLEKASSQELFEDIAYSYKNDKGFSRNVPWRSYAVNPELIVNVQDSEVRSKLIEDFRAATIEVLRERIASNEHTMAPSARDEIRSSLYRLTPYDFDDEEEVYQSFVEQSKRNNNSVHEAANLSDTLTRGALESKDYEQVEIFGDGYCGYRCAVYMAIDHLRDLRQEGRGDWELKATLLATLFDSSGTLMNLVTSDDPIVVNGKLPERIESALTQYANTYIDQEQMVGYICRLIGLSSADSHGAPETGIVSVVKEGGRDFVTYQPLMGEGFTGKPFGPIDSIEKDALPRTIIRFKEGVSSSGNHFDIFRAKSNSV